MQTLRKIIDSNGRLVSFVLLFAFASTAQLVFSAETTKIEMPTRGLCAHRGASDTHPENTLAAFREAVRVGAHQIECDVQFSKDGHLVIMHDDTVDRTTDGKGKISDLTLAEIKKLDAGIKKDPRFAGCRVPTLEETLKMMPKNVWLNLHLKEFKGSRQLGMEVAKELVRQERTHQAFLACGHSAAEGAHEVCPDILICNMERQFGDMPKYINDTIERKCDFIQLLWKVATPEEMKRLKDAGVTINLFQGPTVKSLKEAYEAGVCFPLVNDIAPVMKEAEKYGVKPLEPVY